MASIRRNLSTSLESCSSLEQEKKGQLLFRKPRIVRKFVFSPKKRCCGTIFIISKLDRRPRSMLDASVMGAANVACFQIDDSKLHEQNIVDLAQSLNLSESLSRRNSLQYYGKHSILPKFVLSSSLSNSVFVPFRGCAGSPTFTGSPVLQWYALTLAPKKRTPRPRALCAGVHSG